MAKFLTGPSLTAALHNILEEADQELILISPYIRLHDSVRSSLRTHLNKPQLAFTVVFGKNEDDLSKSLSPDDLVFLMSFPNVRILYEKRLHAKYYANELTALVTSMNLHSFSQNNNIEAGILTEFSLLSVVGAGKDTILDTAAHEAFQRVIEQAQPVFIKSAQFEKTNLGISKKYVRSVVETDNTAAIFKQELGLTIGRTAAIQPAKKMDRPTAVPAISTPANGFCIRTGVAIPFNPKRPMSEEAFNSWSLFSKPDYPEKFCHFSGELSHGETTFAKPIMKKNWSKAKNVHKF